MECKFKIIGEIKSKQRPNFKGHAYTPKTTVNYENYVKSEFLRQCPDVHFGDKPLLAIICAYFSPNQELNKYEAYRVACMNQKDLDNIAKIVLDSLNGIAYNDDRQIVQLEVCKNWIQDEPEHVEVVLKELEIFNTLEELKKEKQIAKLRERYDELIAKPKLTSAEMKRLTEIKTLLKGEM
jgi:Holliday junction resolvase RusA-like endonuclease